MKREFVLLISVIIIVMGATFKVLYGVSFARPFFIVGIIGIICYFILLILKKRIKH